MSQIQITLANRRYTGIDDWTLQHNFPKTMPPPSQHKLDKLHRTYMNIQSKNLEPRPGQCVLNRNLKDFTLKVR